MAPPSPIRLATEQEWAEQEEAEWEAAGTSLIMIEQLPDQYNESRKSSQQVETPESNAMLCRGVKRRRSVSSSNLRNIFDDSDSE